MNNINTNRTGKFTHTILTAFLAFAMLLLFTGNAAAQTVWNGTANTTWYTSNSSETEFTITTAEQFAGLAQLVNDGNDMSDKTIKLGKDIMLNDTTGWESWGTAAPANINTWAAIGNNDNMFGGFFDGNGYVISGVYINNDNDYQGLFGYLGDYGEIENVSIVASYIKGGVGIGGLVGYNYQGSVLNSYYAGAVSGTSNVGGLVGITSNNGKISNSYSTGTVTGTDNYVGGLIGRSSGMVSNSYYDMETSGRTDVGKGEGKTTAEMKSKGFAILLNKGAAAKHYNGWNYIEGRYPILSNVPVSEIDVATYFASGTGTEANPYIIKIKEELEALSVFVNAGKNFNSEYFKLGNDIMLNDTTDWKNWETNPPANSWTAIGIHDAFRTDKPFSGTFDGDGYTINGIYINTGGYQGLFGYLEYGTIKNVGVIASYISGNEYIGGLVGFNFFGTISDSYYIGNVIGNYAVGGLVGSNNSGTTVSNCYFLGDVSGTGRYDDNNIGGLVGYNYGTIIGSYSNGNVNGTEGVGGLVGRNYGTVSGSYSKGMVSGIAGVGGLVGTNDGTVSNSYSIGTVSGKGAVGGLIGINGGTISNSYSIGTVSGTEAIGGLVGNNGDTISNSYSIGDVNGAEKVGGLAGTNFSIVINSYSVGNVSGINFVSGFVGDAGFFVPSEVISSYWDIDWDIDYDSEQNIGYGEIGKTTAEMKTQSTFVDWDFTNIWGISEDINNGYPYLIAVKVVEHEPGNSSSSSGEDGGDSSSSGNSSSSSSEKSNSSSSESGATPIMLPQIANANSIVSIKNGLHLTAISEVIVTLFDTKGTIISSQNYASGVYNIPLSHLPRGMYVAKVSFGSERQVIKAIVR